MPISPEDFMKKLIIAVVATTIAQSAYAQEPGWARIAPAVQAALECRTAPNLEDPDIQLLLSPDGNIDHKSVPDGFTVFGMPVKQITLAHDEDEEERITLSASSLFEGKSLADARRAAGLIKEHARSTPVGTLMASMGVGNLAQISCTFTAK